MVPALRYVNTKFLGECVNQVRRMEAANVFGPMHVQGHGVDEADADRLISHFFLAFLASRGCQPRLRRNYLSTAQQLL